MNKKFLMLGILALAALFILLNCAPDKLSGSLKPNERPRIGVTNIDYYDSLFTFNAVIHWYGLDSDGRVMAYYYIVIPSDEVGEDNEAALAYIDTALSHTELTDWTMTEETAATIQMLASPNETDTLRQYVFFACEDDGGAFSDTMFYPLYRVNRLPQTYLDLLPGNFHKLGSDTTIYTLPVWSIPDTNALWSGLRMSWTSEDTLDFPEGSPDFEYKWEIYGPYDTANFSYTDTLVHLTLDDIDPDSLYISSCSDNDDGYIFAVDGGDCENEWVWDVNVTLTGMPTGCYITVVTARDDAEVPDATPAWGKFVVAEPRWINAPDSVKDVIIIQSTQYKIGSLMNGWPPDSVEIDGQTVYFPDEVMGFYSDMITGANMGYTYDIYGTPAVGNNGAAPATDFPPLFVIANYRMIIIDDMDYTGVEYDKVGAKDSLLESYMNAGGKVWMIGRQCMSPGGSNSVGFINFTAGTMAVDYFDLSAGIYAEANWRYPELRPFGEFVGAISLSGSFGDLRYDSTKAALLGQNGIHKVEALIRNSVYSTSLFMYDAAEPDTMRAFQYMPVAARFFPEHHIFKTSYFSFPLYLMDNSQGQVQAVFTDMLDWFLNQN